ncbi:MAG: gliding motility lipoprotein GldH [Sediminibacterium sp.]|jgi:gliding motility-associated lipoprotein GldH
MAMLKSYKLIVIFLFVLLFISCEPIQLYEQNTTYPSHNWSSKEVNQYQFKITDTSALYKIYFVIRHHNAYHYKNIWLQINTQSPSDTVVQQTLNLQLADDQKGWLGVGMDDIYDQRIPVNATPTKLKMGIYHFSIQHTMREDPLLGVLATGLRVEKVQL